VIEAIAHFTEAIAHFTEGKVATQIATQLFATGWQSIAPTGTIKGESPINSNSVQRFTKPLAELTRHY
jgi:hypothetical protein